MQGELVVGRAVLEVAGVPGGDAQPAVALFDGDVRIEPAGVDVVCARPLLPLSSPEALPQT